jgi:hypothetical protein
MVLNETNKIKQTLLKTKTKKSKYTSTQVLKVFELLENPKIKPQTIADQTSHFSVRQIKKLRYIKKHMNEDELSILLDADYYISSIEKRIKKRIHEEKHSKGDV